MRVAIFDDNKNIRDSISLLLSTEPGFEVVGSFPDCFTCIEDVRDSRPDVILMDIEMPVVDGIEAVRQIRKAFPHVQILMQTVFEDDEKVFDSICAGASGYILKNHINTRIADALRELQYGGSPMSPGIARKVLQMLQKTPVPQPVVKEEYNLTNREKEVLTEVVNGLSYKMIADKLSISYETVRSHIKKIYEKLHVASLTEAVAKAIHQKIV